MLFRMHIDILFGAFSIDPVEAVPEMVSNSVEAKTMCGSRNAQLHWHADMISSMPFGLEPC